MTITNQSPTEPGTPCWKNVRRGAGKWFASLIIIFISITFSLWGISSYFTSASSDALAVVGSHEIRPSEFQRFYQQQYQQLEAMYGDAFRKANLDEGMLKRQLLQTLINQELLIQDLQKSGFTVSDEQVAKHIYEIPAFQSQGKFDPERYRQLLSQANYTPSQLRPSCARISSSSSSVARWSTASSCRLH